MQRPGFQEEKALWKKGLKYVVCLDEVGRGALAGPVVACAVMLRNSKFQVPNSKQISNPKLQISNIKDSKKLTPKIREEFYKILAKHPAIKWSIGRVYPRVIDRINILQATKLAMKRAVKRLKSADYLILDGKMELDLPIPQKSIVKADEKVVSCAIASIIAKVKRDQTMLRYHKKYPRYGFSKHKGYGTLLHRKALNKLGSCAIHRNSFQYGRTKTKTH